MTPFRTALAAASLAVPMAASADVLTITPADPQPDAADLAPGLAVSYAFGSNVRTLAEARAALESSEPGPALAGLSYDTEDGDSVLTAGQPQRVSAAISGYIKFDNPGTYVVDFLTNDGLELSIGDTPVALYDGVHACGYSGEQTLDVPTAGYYALEATYFQRKGSACLLMEWGPDSDGLDYVPDSAFFHAP